LVIKIVCVNCQVPPIYDKLGSKFGGVVVRVNSAFHPSMVGKSCLAVVKVGCVHLCQVEGNTV